MAQPSDSHLPVHNGRNYAPVKPFLALAETNGHRSPYAKHNLADAIKEKYQEKLKENEQSWKEMISVGQMIALFIEGKQQLDWNPFSNAWTPRKLSHSDPNKIKAVNFMQYYSTMWQSKWGSSNPDIVVQARSVDDREIAKARKVNAVAEYLETTLYGSATGSRYKYHEGLMAQCFGWYGNRVRPCYKSGRSVMRPIIEEREVSMGDGWGKCHDCDYSGPGPFNSVQISQTDSMPLCPNCGSTGVVYEPPVTQMMQHETGQERVKLPNIIAEALPFPACRWDIRHRMCDSPWALYEQEGNENAIRRVIGEIRLPEGDTSNTFGLDAVATLSAMGSPMGGKSDVQNTKRSGPTISELYLSADDLYDIIISGDEQTVEGDNLPTGARASDIFPDGCCAVGINGFNLLWGLYAEHHSQTISDGVYHMKPLSGTGRGVVDATEIQKRFNRFDSQAVRWMQTRATPATLHAEGAIPPNKRQLLSQPDVDIPISLQNFPEVRSVKDLVWPMQGESIPGDMLQYTYQHLSNFMQLAYHITDFSNGLNPRVQNDTATGAEILDANADALFHPALDIKAEVAVDTIRKAFDLWCSYNPVPQYVPVKSKAGSGMRGMDISGPEIEGDYYWTFVPGSQQPKNRLTIRRDRIAFYQLFGGIGGYIMAKQQNPQEVAQAERDFDMDFATDDFDDIGELCRTRYEFAKTIMEKATASQQFLTQQYGVPLQPPNPLMILPEVKPTMLVTEPDHVAKVTWFQKLLDTTEGREMTDDERNLVSAFVQGHGMLAQGQAIAIGQAQTEAEMGAQAPAAEAQNQAATDQATAEQQAQVEADAQAHSQDMEKKAQDHQMDLDKQSKEHQMGMVRDAFSAAIAPKPTSKA